MTDLETMRAMVARAGLQGHRGSPGHRNEESYPPGYTCLVIGRGCGGLFTEIVFDKEGALSGIYAWE
jgi:hypothetical protein